MALLEQVLTHLEPYGVTTYKQLVTSGTVTSIVQSSAGQFQVNFSANIAGVNSGHWLYLGFGTQNEGFYRVQMVGASHVIITSTTVVTEIGITASATIYALRLAKLNDHILAAQKYVQRVTGFSFEGVETITEYHDGTGYEEMMLDRRPIIALQSITLLALPNTVLSIPLSAVEVMPGLGILRVRAINLEAYTFLAPIWPKGRFNLKLVYTAGYLTAPTDVLLAQTYLTCAMLLGEAAAVTGGETSLSVVAYSANFGNRGRYSTIRNDMVMQARSLLAPYKTSVVGN